MASDVMQLANQIAAHKKRQVVFLKLAEVRPKASQVRKIFLEIESLAASILQEGQIQPIVVSEKNSAGYHVIQQGERRWRACQQAGLIYIEAIISKNPSALDEMAGELIENIQRETLSPMEIANALRCFVNEGWQQQEIATRLGKNSTFISTHLSLLKMTDCILEVYRAGATRDVETLNNLRLLFELDSKKCREICRVALHQGITRQQSRERLDEAKQLAEKPKNHPSRVTNVVEESVDCQSVPKVVDTAIASDDCANEPTPCISEGNNDIGKNNDATLSCLTTRCGDGWRSINAARLRIVVNVLHAADFQRGIIMADRVDSEPEYIWVKIFHGGQEKIVRVPAADIELVRVAEEML